MQTNFEILHNAMNEIIQIYERSYMNPENFKQYQIAKKAINNMKDFNAEMARANSKQLDHEEIDDILTKIEVKSKCRPVATLLHVYKSLNASTVEVLRDRGFKVHVHDGIELSRDGLYYTIEW